MKIRFKIDKKSTEITDSLTRRYNLGISVISRIAVAISLQTGKVFGKEEVIPTLDGREYTPTSDIFGYYINDEDNFPIYLSIFNQHYNQNLTQSEFIRLYQLHLADGLKVWSQQLETQSTLSGGHIDYLAGVFKQGLALKPTVIKTTTTKQAVTNEFKSLLAFELGQYDDGSSVVIELNNLKLFDNRNIAIAGMAGSGKTQLIKDVLYQISQNTDHQLKFIFFDYKGEGSSSSLKPFLDATQCHFVDIIESGGMQFNPLQSISLEEKNRLFSIKAFVDTIATFIPNIGESQKNILRNVLTEIFDKCKGEYPSVNDLFNRLEKYYEDNKKKPDTLFAGIQDLSTNIFNCESNNTSLLDESLYLNLPPALSDTLRQLIVFLILRYLTNYFSSTDDCTPEGNIFPVRYVMVIDEAHIYLKNKNASKALEEMLRLLRSKGVIIVMLSQGANDYKTKNFDFVSQVKLPICLNIQNKDYKTIVEYLGTPNSKYQLEQTIEQLTAGKGIIHINEPKIFTLNQWWQRQESNL
ncbi:MAG: DndE family protein [Pasteurella sp.]|nr:DndE family protein [Pasteurella sp.]